MNFSPLEGWPGESDRPLLLTLPEGPYVCLAEAQVVDYVRTKFKLSTEKKEYDSICYVWSRRRYCSLSYSLEGDYVLINRDKYWNIMI